MKKENEYFGVKLIKKWEKAFEKKMTKEERNMFLWGMVYGVEEVNKILNQK